MCARAGQLGQGEFNYIPDSLDLEDLLDDGRPTAQRVGVQPNCRCHRGHLLQGALSKSPCGTDFLPTRTCRCEDPSIRYTMVVDPTKVKSRISTDMMDIQGLSTNIHGYP